MNEFTRIFGLLALALLLVGCFGEDDSTSGQTGQAEDDAFRNALPNSETLKLEVPESEGSKKIMLRAVAAPVGETSAYYLETVQTTRAINFSVTLLLSWLDILVQYPPSERLDNARIWGPWQPDDALSQIEQRLVVTENTESGTFEYSMEARKLDNEDGEWTKIWYGNVEPDATQAHHGIGDLTLDFDAAAEIDPAVVEQGRLVLDYDTVSDGRRIEVEFIDFVGEDSDGEVGNGSYSYHSHADGTGRYSFTLVGDIHADDPDKDLPELEDIQIVATWQADGRGRADASVTGGDLEAESFKVVECWDTSFQTSYYIESAVLDGEEYFDEDGDEESCPEVVPES